MGCRDGAAIDPRAINTLSLAINRETKADLKPKSLDLLGRLMFLKLP